MTTALIDIIAGARPNFMKIAPLIRALEERAAAGGHLRHRLVHTGQHYDTTMSGDFFAQLGIPAPHVNLEVGSGSHAGQTAAIMTRYERLLLEAPPAALLDAVGEAARGLPVVFPVHPRTANTLALVADLPANIRRVPPQPYLEFNHLVRHAKAVVTDSGGITEETTVMGVPCMTLRDSTERPETVTVGNNELLGTDPAALRPAFDRLFAGRWKRGSIPEKWDGRTAPRIVAVLERVLPAI